MNKKMFTFGFIISLVIFFVVIFGLFFVMRDYSNQKAVVDAFTYHECTEYVNATIDLASKSEELVSFTRLSVLTFCITVWFAFVRIFKFEDVETEQ